MKDRPTKNGSTGMSTRDTSMVMTRSSSSKRRLMVSDFVQAMATPKTSASVRALMTLNSGGISRRKTISGSLRSVSVLVAMDR